MGNPSTSLLTSQHFDIPTPPGPPFPVNSAVNGCSVDPVSGAIVWGNDVGLFTALLLSDRELPMGAKKVTWLNGTNRQFQVDPLNFFYALGDIDGANFGTKLVIDDGATLASLGDVSNVITGLQLKIDTGNQILRILGTGGIQDYFIIDIPNQQYQFGNIGNNTDGITLAFDGVSDNAIIRKKANTFLSLDFANFLYRIGDINGSNNGSFLSIDDAASSLVYSNSAGSYFSIVPPLVTGNSVYTMGDDNAGDGIFTITGGGSSKEAFIRLGASEIVLDLNKTTGIYQLGDISLTGNGNMLYIDDVISTISSLGDVFGLGNGTVLQISDNSGTVVVNANSGVYIYCNTGAAAITMLGDPTLLHTASALSDNPGVGLGTLTNAPSGGGDPTKWIAIDDNGTMRFIPTWV